MNALYLVLPLALLVAAGAVAAFVWSVRSGQLDDVDTPPRRMLLDDHVVSPANRAGFAPRVQPVAEPAADGALTHPH